MYYEINVSLKGMHLLATHKRSIQSDQKLAKVLTILEKRFSVNDGYLITVSKVRESGRYLNSAEINLIQEKYK